MGITLSHLLSHGRVWLTDLDEAQDIVSQNLRLAKLPQTKTSPVRANFRELNWEEPLRQGDASISNSPGSIDASEEGEFDIDNVDLVIAADCTYNADSRSVS